MRIQRSASPRWHRDLWWSKLAAVSMGTLTLSAIEGWDTEHLESAARTWDATAEHWEDTFSAIHRGSLNPGGTVWEGEGAEAAQRRAFADLVKVRGWSDHLYEAAKIARRGADQLDYLKRAALDAVDEARGAGFNVGEDLSVSDRSMVPLGPAFAARQAQAQTLAAEIRLRAAALSAADHQIAANITAATSPLSGVAFDEESATGFGPAPQDEKKTVQAVSSHGLKLFGNDRRPLSPSPSPTPSPSPSPSPGSGIAPISPGDLKPFDPEGGVIEKSGEQVAKRATGRVAEAARDISKFGKYMGRLGVVGELGIGIKEFGDELKAGKSIEEASIDVAPKTMLGIGGSWAGTTVGAASGAAAGAVAGGKIGKVLSFIPGGETAGKAIGAVVGAGAGAFGGGLLGGDVGETLGESVSGVIRGALG